jgi:hypothetical protein
MLSPSQLGAAEWQIKPFMGVTFGGDTTFVSAETQPNVALGVSGVLLGEVVGVEGTLETARGLFVGAPDPILASGNTTQLTGNFVLAAPRRLTQYTLRPYFVGGGGIVRVRIDRPSGGAAFAVAETLPAIDLGGGVTGFLTDRIGLSWEARWYRTTSNNNVGLSVGGPEELSFWRASMAVAIRLTRSSQ